MNISDLSEHLAKEFKIPQKKARQILIFVLDEIKQEVSACNRVYFRGFGSFNKELKPRRRYRDPISGEMKISPEDLRVRFRAFFDI